MGFLIVILGAIIICVAFSCTTGDTDGANTPPRLRSDFRENEFDDEVEDFDRFFDEDL